MCAIAFIPSLYTQLQFMRVAPPGIRLLKKDVQPSWIDVDEGRRSYK